MRLFLYRLQVVWPALIKLWLRHRFCYLTNGGHELYRAHTEDKLFQQCLLCGYQTRGWTIDRRDRPRRILRLPANRLRRKTDQVRKRA